MDTTELADVLVMTPVPHRDSRGLFTRTLDAAEFDEAVAAECGGAAGDVRFASFIQDSQSRSYRGVVRGLHGRFGRGEAKLVRCAHGVVFDVLVDIRPGSSTFGRHQAFTLDDVDFRHLYVPPGFLHGFQAISAVADVCYRIDRPHDPAEDIGVHHADPDLGIAWPLPVTQVSRRDAAADGFARLRRRLGGA